MAVYSLAPSFIKMAYTANGHPHVQVLPVWAVQAGLTWNLRPVESAVDIAWQTYVDTYLVVVKAMFPAASNFNSAQLWTQATAGADPVFQANYAFAVAGTNVTASQALVQTRFSYRTHKGGLLLLQFMEASFGANIRDVVPLTDATMNGFHAHVLGDSACIFGRDGGRPIALTSVETKVNDKLRKKYLVTT